MGDQTVLRLSHSAIEAFLNCPRSYYLKNVANVEAVDRTQFSFGSTFHAFLEEYWSSDGSPETRPTRAIEALRSKASLEKLSADDLVVAEQLAIGYCAAWDATLAKGETEKRVVVGVLNPQGEVDESMQLKSIFDLELSEPRVLYEHKTTKQAVGPDSAYWDRVRTSQQLDIYFIAGEDDDIAEKIQFVVWDLVVVPKLKRRYATPLHKREFYARNCKYGKKGDPKPGTYLTAETVEEFSARVATEIQSNPAYYYQSHQLYPNKNQLEATRYDIWATGKLIQNAFEHEAWPRNRNGCRTWGRRCEFYPVCFENVNAERSELYTISNRPSPLRVRDNSGDGTTEQRNLVESENLEGTS